MTRKDDFDGIRTLESLKKIKYCPDCGGRTYILGETVICIVDGCTFIRHYSTLLPSDILKGEKKKS